MGCDTCRQARAASLRNTRAIRKAAGRCTQCNGKVVEQGLSKCKRCRERAKENAERRKPKQEAGICKKVGCTESKDGRSFCKAHREEKAKCDRINRDIREPQSTNTYTDQLGFPEGVQPYPYGEGYQGQSYTQYWTAQGAGGNTTSAHHTTGTHSLPGIQSLGLLDNTTMSLNRVVHEGGVAPRDQATLDEAHLLLDFSMSSPRGSFRDSHTGDTYQYPRDYDYL